ncbi:MAG TPA: double zinc ribbon domain-containing protein [Candidatus Acidoferrum sp.]|nr:double zinc ribbon domain-containing protein [Candidatus Acidoferrum sp.]
MPLANPRVYAARWLGTLAGALTSVFFPSGCRLCEALLTRGDRLPICDACLASFQKLAPTAICERCGQPWTNTNANAESGALCGECRERGFAFDAARSYGIYGGALARAIVLQKFERIEPLGLWFAKRLVEVTDGQPEKFGVDLVVPVPLHRTRQKERGFNQVDLFGRPLARRLGLPYRPVLLKRERPRPEKHLLHFEERWEAVRGAFVIRQGGPG